MLGGSLPIQSGGRAWKAGEKNDHAQTAAVERRVFGQGLAGTYRTLGTKESGKNCSSNGPKGIGFVEKEFSTLPKNEV